MGRKKNSCDKGYDLGTVPGAVAVPHSFCYFEVNAQSNLGVTVQHSEDQTENQKFQNPLKTDSNQV